MTYDEQSFLFNSAHELGLHGDTCKTNDECTVVDLACYIAEWCSVLPIPDRLSPAEK